MILSLLQLYGITLGVAFCAGLGWRLARDVWPHIHPWTGYSKGRRVLVLGKQVICRIPFTKPMQDSRGLAQRRLRERVAAVRLERLRSRAVGT